MRVLERIYEQQPGFDLSARAIRSLAEKQKPTDTSRRTRVLRIALTSHWQAEGRRSMFPACWSGTKGFTAQDQDLVIPCPLLPRNWPFQTPQFHGIIYKGRVYL